MEVSIIWADIIIFTAYVVYVLAAFGIPVNLSITYYMFERKKKGTGLLFPALMVFICSTTLPILILTTSHASEWGARFVALPVICLVCLLAVACSARYKVSPKLIYFHYACAIITATCAVAWIFLVAYKICYVGIAILCALLLAGILTKTLRKCPLFWLENAAFYAILFTLLVIHSVPVHV